MGVEKTVLKEGNGVDKPSKGDEVTIEYTGNLYDEEQADNHYRGTQSAPPSSPHLKSFSPLRDLDSTPPWDVGIFGLRSAWAQ